MILLSCKVGLDKENRTPHTKLLYVTTGVLKASYYALNVYLNKITADVGE